MSPEPLIWHTEKRKVKDLIPWERNPRQMTDKQAEDLKASLAKFNLMSIPVINTDNLLISGHQRMKILGLLGRAEEEIDVRVPNRALTEEEIAEANIRENKNLGEWDFDLLAKFDEDLLKNIGFDSKELDKIFEASVSEDDFDAQKAYESITEPFVKYGDIY